MLAVIQANIDAPGLFRTRGSSAVVKRLRKALEDEQGIPEGTDVYAVSQCLLQWLYELQGKVDQSTNYPVGIP